MNLSESYPSSAKLTGTEDPDAPIGAGFDFADPNSPLARFYLSTSQVVAVLAIGFLFVLTTRFTLWHTDVWGHVRYGQWMAERGTIPDREPFCPWWDGRITFTQFYTFSQLAMYEAYALGAQLAGGDEIQQMAGGVEMLRTMHGLLNVGRFLLLLWAFQRVTRSFPLALVGLVAVTLLDLSNLAVFRPQVFGQLLFAAILIPLSLRPISRAGVFAIPVLMVIWANTHGSFLMGFVLIGLLAVGRAVECLAQGLPTLKQDQEWRRLVMALGLSFIAVGVINPYGFSYYGRALELGKHPSLLTAVGEWQPLAFEWAMGWHWVLLVSLGISAATVLASPRTIRPGPLLCLLAFGLGVAVQNRLVIWWAMVLPWVLLEHWAAIVEANPERFNRAPSSPPSLRKTLMAVALAIALFMWSIPAGWLAHGSPTPVEDAISSGTPWKLARQLKNPKDPESVWLPEMKAILDAHYPNKQFTGAVLATPMQGDYLMWSVAPEIPVTYSHIHLFHPDFWDELGIVGNGDPGWWDVLDKYNVNLILAEADFATRLREEVAKAPGWKVLLDEAGSPDKPQTLNRQFIAIRVRPLRPVTP